jgi:hypothetical protein
VRRMLLSLWERLKRVFQSERPLGIGTLFVRKEAQSRAVRVEDLPDDPKPFKLYIAGKEGCEWAAALLCPCGCGETIQLNLLREVRPCWSIFDGQGRVSLEPSVWRSRGCRSHFFLRNGEIEWCNASRHERANRKKGRRSRR